jgi:hypothetical protein
MQSLIMGNGLPAGKEATAANLRESGFGNLAGHKLVSKGAR